jgi:hypothetical protein
MYKYTPFGFIPIDNNDKPSPIKHEYRYFSEKEIDLIFHKSKTISSIPFKKKSSKKSSSLSQASTL